MNVELNALYQEVILDHNRYPRNHHALPTATAKADGYNPLCGDCVTVYLSVQDSRLEAVSFEGKGCAISQASASMMTELVMGKTLDEANDLFQSFVRLLTSESDAIPSLHKLNVLLGVKQYPARVKCATLAWHTLDAALHPKNHPVTTE